MGGGRAGDEVEARPLHLDLPHQRAVEKRPPLDGEIDRLRREQGDGDPAPVLVDLEALDAVGAAVEREIDVGDAAGVALRAREHAVHVRANPEREQGARSEHQDADGDDHEAMRRGVLTVRLESHQRAASTLISPFGSTTARRTTPTSSSPCRRRALSSSCRVTRSLRAAASTMRPSSTSTTGAPSIQRSARRERNASLPSSAVAASKVAAATSAADSDVSWPVRAGRHRLRQDEHREQVQGRELADLALAREAHHHDQCAVEHTDPEHDFDERTAGLEHGPSSCIMRAETPGERVGSPPEAARPL